MTTIAQTDCCTLLGIDPKTLRHWLRQANMQFIAHPSDARCKCLTQAQVQHLAALHARPLPATLTAPQLEQHEPLPPAPSDCLPSAGGPAADLVQSLARLQAQVTTMQQQLTELALQLLRERERRLEGREQRQQHTEQPLCTPEAPLPIVAEQSLPPPASQRAEVPDRAPLKSSPACPAPRPGAARGRRGVLPLIASTATGSYVVICPSKGELALLPDSPAWFDWLATLTSFRFVGRQGRLSTYRNSGRSSWMAYRRIHGHRYEYGLGQTKLLTIERLERMAATLQAHAPSLR